MEYFFHGNKWTSALIQNTLAIVVVVVLDQSACCTVAINHCHYYGSKIQITHRVAVILSSAEEIYSFAEPQIELWFVVSCFQAVSFGSSTD